jgi:CheY-like chemotaxis protein
MVAGNPTQLHQVLMNLCLNARDAMPTGGTLRIGLENFAVDADFAGRNPGLAPGPHVVLTVRDSGTGIAPDILDKIFDPFFTTKTLGGGTGLGLSTVLGIVKSHGGIIHVASPVGEGAQFRVYLPAVPAVVIPAAGAAAPAPAPVGRGETILVVDDELAVRLVMRKLLEKNHYRVVEAADGREGLAVFRLHRATIAAVITDLLMPVLDGPAFIRELRAIDANVPVIAASGHLDGAEFPPEQRAAVQAVLAKPYAVDALLECLHGVLKAARLRLTATAGRGPPSAEAYGGCGAPSVDG